MILFPGMETAPALQPQQQQVVVHKQLKKAPLMKAARAGRLCTVIGKLLVSPMVFLIVSFKKLDTISFTFTDNGTTSETDEYTVIFVL